MVLRRLSQIDAGQRADRGWMDWVRSALRTNHLRNGLLIAGLGLTVLVSFWSTLQTMAERWWSDPQYSHGFLVPGFAAVVLWFRRERLHGIVVRSTWWGLPILLVGIGCRLAAAAIGIEPLDAFALLPTLAGLVLLLGGWGVWQWSWPAIAFLAFMLPMPFQLEVALAQPLRRLATVSSTYVLQTLGYPALAEGNIIHIEELKLGVIDACSGLGMLVTFFALATATAMVARAPWRDRVVLVVSAIPIAVIANIARITATAAAHYTLGESAGKLVMHDLAGWLMMPLALILLCLELRFLSRLFLAVDDTGTQPVFVSGAVSVNGHNGALPAPKKFSDVRSELYPCRLEEAAEPTLET
jgi:exosortase